MEDIKNTNGSSSNDLTKIEVHQTDTLDDIRMDMMTK